MAAVKTGDTIAFEGWRALQKLEQGAKAVLRASKEATRDAVNKIAQAYLTTTDLLKQSKAALAFARNIALLTGQFRKIPTHISAGLSYTKLFDIALVPQYLLDLHGQVNKIIETAANRRPQRLEQKAKDLVKRAKELEERAEKLEQEVRLERSNHTGGAAGKSKEELVKSIEIEKANAQARVLRTRAKALETEAKACRAQAILKAAFFSLFDLERTTAAAATICSFLNSIGKAGSNAVAWISTFNFLSGIIGVIMVAFSTASTSRAFELLQRLKKLQEDMDKAKKPLEQQHVVEALLALLNGELEDLATRLMLSNNAQQALNTKLETIRDRLIEQGLREPAAQQKSELTTQDQKQDAQKLLCTLRGRASTMLGFQVGELAIRVAGAAAGIISMACPVPLVATAGVGAAVAGASICLYGARELCINQNPFEEGTKAPLFRALDAIKRSAADARARLVALHQRVTEGTASLRPAST